MISTEEVLQVHRLLIGTYGGSHGIRDMAALESAINRPFATFDKEDLYSTPQAKSAAIFESIIINHPFVDGNKRTAYVLMRLMLLKNHLDISASVSEKYGFVIDAAMGKLTFDDIKIWIEDHSIIL